MLSNVRISRVDNGFIVDYTGRDESRVSVEVYESTSAALMMEEVCKRLGIHNDVYAEQPQTEEEKRTSKTLTEDSV